MLLDVRAKFLWVKFNNLGFLKNGEMASIFILV